MDNRVLSFFALLTAFLLGFWIIALEQKPTDTIFTQGASQSSSSKTVQNEKAYQEESKYRDTVSGIDITVYSDPVRPIISDPDNSLLLSKKDQESKPDQRKNPENPEGQKDSTLTGSFLSKLSSNIAFLVHSNPFRKLISYSPINNDNQTQTGDITKLTAKEHSHYCDLVDMTNFFEYERFFSDRNYFTNLNLSSDGLDIESLLSDSKRINLKNSRLSPLIQVFLTRNDSSHSLPELEGSNFCISQQYSIIPNDSVLTNYSKFQDALGLYQQKWVNAQKAACFNKAALIPQTYRLNNETECTSFFDKLSQKSNENSTNYYIMRVYNETELVSMDILTAEKIQDVFRKFDSKVCHEEDSSSEIAYTTVQILENGPLLFEDSFPFIVKSFLMVTSTNPLIVHYHDGFLEVSKKASEKETVKDLIFEGEDKSYKTYNHLQSFLETKKLKNPDTFLKSLRKILQNATINVARTVEPNLTPRGGAYRVYTLNFLMDTKFKLWLLNMKSSLDLHVEESTQELVKSLIVDLFDIQFAYLKSRMKRVFHLISDFVGGYDVLGQNEDPDEIAHYQKLYNKMSRDYIERDFNYAENNTWIKVVDRNENGEDVFGGFVKLDCLD